MLDPPHIGHGSRTDQQTGHPKRASHRQFAGRERMFHTSDGCFDGCSQVVIFFFLVTALAST
jgi:hypothetical protein